MLKLGLPAINYMPCERGTAHYGPGEPAVVAITLRLTKTNAGIKQPTPPARR